MVPGGISCLLQHADAYEYLPSSVAVFDNQGRVRYRNPAARQLDAMLYQNRSTNPEQRGLLSLPDIGTILLDACRERTEKQISHTFYYGRNMPVTVALRIRPVINQESDAVDGAMLTIGQENVEFDRRHLARAQSERLDLVERIKQLSASQLENEKLIRILLSEMPFPLVLFDSERRILQINRAAEKLFGVHRRQAIGQRCNNHLNCYEKSGPGCPVMEKEKGIKLDELATLPLAGMSRQLLRTAVPLSGNEQPMILEAFIDITERKKSEQKLARYREELEDLVAERTAKLEQSNRELESFSYSVSHDLRSPLRAIDGYSFALMEEYGDKLDDAGMDYLDRVRKAAQRMGQLIDDLLQLSRVSRNPLRRQDTDISGIAREIAGELSSGATQPGASVIVQPALRARADPGLVRAILANLIENAWKFTLGRKQATIEVGKVTIDGDAVFFVRDNGVGFSMDYADKLFEPFHVLHPGSTATGSGIGLATVQRIVERHGGCIWAQSAPDAGATFYFTLEP